MPSSPQVVTARVLFDYVYDETGAAVVGARVIAVLNFNTPSVQSPVVNLQPKQQVTTTDQNGYWQFSLVPNDTLTPAGTVYTIMAPGSTYDVSIPSGGTPVQSSSILVNTPSVLSPALTNLTGPITVTGNESVTGTLSVTGATTLGSLTAGATTLGASTVGGDLTIGSAFRLLFGAAISKLVPGATSFSVRDNADVNDNLLVSNAGAVTTRGDTTIGARLLLSTAVSKLVPGATSLSLRNHADANDNLLVTDAGNVTARGQMSYASLAMLYKASAYLAANQTMATGTTQIAFDTKNYDPNTNFTTGASAHYTVPITGYYRITAVANFNILNNPQTGFLAVFRNAAELRRLSQWAVRGATGGDIWGWAGSSDESLTANDSIDIRWNTSGPTSSTVTGGSNLTWVMIHYLSS